MLLTLSDADVQELLAVLRVEPTPATPESRRKLLQRALQQAQRIEEVLEASGSSQLDPDAFAHLASSSAAATHDTPISLAWLKCDVFTMQEAMTDERLHNEWFHVRRVLQDHAVGFATHGIRRLNTTTHDGTLGGFVDVLSMRQAPGGQPLLELQVQFYELASAPKAALAAEQRSAPRGDTRFAKMTPLQLRLLAALLDASAACLDPAYVAARKAAAGRHFEPSVLLPLRPLLQDKLPKMCKVCGKEGAKSCRGCHMASYCSTDCQLQDWKQHKPACKKAQAAVAAARHSRSSVLVDLSGGMGLPDGSVGQAAPYVLNSRGQVCFTAGQPSTSQAASNPSARFIVKIQAPLTSFGPEARDVLLMYAEGRRMMTYIRSSEQAEAYGRLLSVIRKVGYMGARAYFWAVLQTDHKLLVMTDNLPGQTQDW